jgi:SM-20-related protein
MWLNNAQVCDSAVSKYQDKLLNSHPNHIVIDGLFNDKKLARVLEVLQQANCWQTQKHTYSALYVDNEQWQKASRDQRFVKRDIWQRNVSNLTIADDFLAFLRGDEFMSLLSQIFNVALTDENVANPTVHSKN